MGRKFREARPYLKKNANEDQTFAFTIEKKDTDLKYIPPVESNYTVNVKSNKNAAVVWRSVGPLQISYERTKANKNWKSVIVTLRYYGPAAKNVIADPGDDEEVTIEVVSPTGVVSEINKDTDVVVDFP